MTPVEDIDQGHLVEEIDRGHPAETTEVECPECAVTIRGRNTEATEAKLGKHLYAAHDVDRRSDSTSDDGNQVPPPPAKPGSSGREREPGPAEEPDDGEEVERTSRHNRWWGGRFDGK
jgi:hypothetical protein